MQDRYTGDVGDFGKYGFLRWIAGDREAVRLGINWYLAALENNNDGGNRVRRYLNDDDVYRRCDPPLYDFLQRIQRNDTARPGELPRKVATIHSSGLFANNACYFDELLTFDGLPSIGKKAREAREEHREDWQGRALELLDDADIVFLDPDNGIERSSKKPHLADGPKFVFYSELDAHVQRNKTVVIYQHATRKKGGFVNDIRQMTAALVHRYNNTISTPVCCRFRSHGSRAFIVMPGGQDRKYFADRAIAITADPHWSRFFSLI